VKYVSEKAVKKTGGPMKSKTLEAKAGPSLRAKRGNPAIIRIYRQ